jgi:hypothetical protein
MPLASNVFSTNKIVCDIFQSYTQRLISEQANKLIGAYYKHTNTAIRYPLSLVRTPARPLAPFLASSVTSRCAWVRSAVSNRMTWQRALFLSRNKNLLHKSRPWRILHRMSRLSFSLEGGLTGRTCLLRLLNLKPLNFFPRNVGL